MFVVYLYSMHEMGIFDLPATVDYILEKTNRQKLSIIGYSMGGLISFVFLSTRKEYNDKVGLNVCFAPVCSFNDHIIGGPLNYFLVNLRKETEVIFFNNKIYYPNFLLIELPLFFKTLIKLGQTDKIWQNKIQCVLNYRKLELFSGFYTFYRLYWECLGFARYYLEAEF